MSGRRARAVTIVEALREAFPNTIDLHDLCPRVRSKPKIVAASLDELVDVGLVVQRGRRTFVAASPPAGATRSEWLRAKDEVRAAFETRVPELAGT